MFKQVSTNTEAQMHVHIDVLLEAHASMQIAEGGVNVTSRETI